MIIAIKQKGIEIYLFCLCKSLAYYAFSSFCFNA